MNKHFLYCVFLILLSSFISQDIVAQSKAVNSFYRKYDRKDDEIVKLKLQRWMIGLGKLMIRVSGQNDEMTQLALDLSKTVKKGKLLVIEDSTQIVKDDISAFIQDLKEESFEELMTIRDESSKINIFIKEKNDVIRSIILVVYEPDNFVMMSLKTKMTLEELSKVIKAYQETEHDSNKDQESVPEEQNNEVLDD